MLSFQLSSALLFLSLILTNCAAFESHQKINLAPFAENAVSIVSEVEYGLSQGRAIHIRPYIDGAGVTKYKQRWERLGKILQVKM